MALSKDVTGQELGEKVEEGEPKQKKFEDRIIKVLLVEDNPMDQLVMCRILMKLNSSACVHCAENAAAAKKLLAENSYQLILSDINLGEGKTGLDLMLEKGRLNQHSPFVFVSGIGYETFLKKVKSGFFTGYVSQFIKKPINVHETIRMIQNVLNHSQG